MVSMLLAVKDIPTNRFVFVQYPTRPDPANLNKVVPDPYLAPVLLKRIAADQPVRLTHAASGYSTTSVKARRQPSASRTPSHSSSSTAPQPAALSGLNGQTADQQTCSVALETDRRRRSRRRHAITGFGPAQSIAGRCSPAAAVDVSDEQDRRRRGFVRGPRTR